MIQHLRILGLAALTQLFLAVPVYASGESTALPEPNSITLLSLGVLGVIVGRKLSSKRPND